MDSEEKAKAVVSGLEERVETLSRMTQDDDSPLGEATVAERYQRWKVGTTKFLRERISDVEAKKFTLVEPVARLPGRRQPPRWFRDGMGALAFLNALIQDLKEHPQDVLEVGKVLGEVVEEDRRSGMGTLRIFISHASTDSVLAGNLIKLLRLALGLPSETIRCTSVDGYRLPVGANTDEFIREEVLKVEVVLGIISTASLESLYVAFELGARWGTGRDLSPLMAPGVNPSALKGPLGGMNALRTDNSAQLHQLVHDIGKKLRITPNPPASYQSEIDGILKLAPAPPPVTEREEVSRDQSNDSNDRSPETVSDDDRRLLELLFSDRVSVNAIEATRKGLSLNLARSTLERLQGRGFLTVLGSKAGIKTDYIVSGAGSRAIHRAPKR